MKKMMMTIAFALVTLGAFAQKEQPVGLRMEVAEAETDHAEYSIFTYRDEDDNFGYYLSLAKVTHILGLLRDDIPMQPSTPSRRPASAWVPPTMKPMPRSTPSSTSSTRM